MSLPFHPTAAAFTSAAAPFPPLRRSPTPSGAICGLCAAIACAAFDVSGDRLMGPTRGGKDVALARHVAIYLAHVVFQMPMGAVADGFGRERTSIGHAVRRVEDLRDNETMDARLERLEHLCRLCVALPDEG